MTWLIVAVVFAAPPAVRAQLAPDARCEHALVQALERSGAVELVRADPELVVALTGDALVLRRPGGEQLLRRSLAQTECRDVAFASVLIIERFLHGIDLHAPPPPAPPAPAPAPAPAPRARAAAPPPVEPPDAGPPPEPEPEPEIVDAGEPPPEPAVVDAGAPAIIIAVEPAKPPLVFELAASGGIDFATTAHGLLAAELSVALERVRVSVLGEGSTPESSSITIDSTPRGRLETQTFGARVTGGACVELGVQLCADLQAGARFARGTTAGDFVFQTTTSVLVRPAFGLEARVAWAWRALVFSAALDGLLDPLPAEFTVEGVPSATRRLPIFLGQLRIGIGWRVFRERR